MIRTLDDDEGEDGGEGESQGCGCCEGGEGSSRWVGFEEVCNQSNLERMVSV